MQQQPSASSSHVSHFSSARRCKVCRRKQSSVTSSLRVKVISCPRLDDRLKRNSSELPWTAAVDFIGGEGLSPGSEAPMVCFSRHTHMSLSQQLLRRVSAKSGFFRHFSTAPTSGSSLAHHQQHEFSPPSSYINSWKQPWNPKEAARQLALLRRDYDRKVKEIRKEYINEMELLRMEKLRKDEARKEALRIANEERRAAKAAKKKAEAIERQATEKEFRQMLMKERTEKLEYWRMREKKVQEQKEVKKELLRRQSSKWFNESDIVKIAMNNLYDNEPAGFPNFK